MKYQIIRYWGNSKGYGKIFDSYDEAAYYINTNDKIQEDMFDGFTFDIEVIEE